MNERINGWVYRQVDECMNGLMEERIHWETDE